MIDRLILVTDGEAQTRAPQPGQVMGKHQLLCGAAASRGPSQGSEENGKPARAAQQSVQNSVLALRRKVAGVP